ncbi:asparagine synthase (glutamine-hydrolyzing) [Permianibacter sp. IMCC34836]|uniref:asparagine synthase (glutamine-hydrolyzing) n=1 Tax=Permianibacter fluminis TaxID=2738515 RepID=UPI001552C66A|nr:asparagine synthase (glutamine-hydrolyzing) [Permianibacter fluminis]NQD35590.1 asparagine synthase (glutamine-hydrolyzing) [Permianibacter fluminis]
MCGIYGQLRFDGQTVPRERLTAMGNAMIHRGPDDEGAFTDGPIGIGMRRLSIIDLNGGHQPFVAEAGKLALVANGEVYNFQALRRELEAAGHVFRSHSDCETILWGYLQWGLDTLLQKLNGMYAFALWDGRSEQLIVARDRIGIKPLYYHFDGKSFSFASEAKSLFPVGIRPELNKDALPAYLSLGYVPAPQTLFAGIQKLPVATVAIIKAGELRLKNYWSIGSSLATYSENEWQEKVRAELDRAIAMQMVADVPLGAFLSGGIDSSAVVAYMAKHASGPVKTYAIGFDGDAASRYYNELPYARKVAELFGTEHHEILVKPDVARLLPQLLWQLDEPMADSAFLTTYLVSEFARRDVTVILSGVGGDELFGGYRRYLGEHYAGRYQKLPAMARSGLRAIAKRLPSDRHNRWLDLARLARGFILSADMPFEDRYRSYVQVFAPDAISALLAKDAGGHKSHNSRDPVHEAFARANNPDHINRLLQVDAQTQLPDDLLLLTDKMSMAVSLECRVPLLDHELLELAASMPASIKVRGGELKSLLKKSLRGLLPDEILYRKKRGFGAPMGAWLRGQLLPLMQQVLSAETVAARGLFDPAAVQRVMQEHLSQQADHTDHLQALLNLELWCRLYLDGHSVEQVKEDLLKVAA